MRDRGGNTTTQEAALLVDLTPPALAVASPKDGSTSLQSPVSVNVTYGDALSGVDPASFAASLDGKDITPAFSVGATSATASVPVPPGKHDLEVRIADNAGNTAVGRSTFSVSSLLPPDPKTVSPPLDRTVATSVADATSFLYQGANPIQFGVAPGTIEKRRAAVIRGAVRTASGNALAGVRIAILGHPELGHTLSRSDGFFDLAVNGGGLVTVDYSKDGWVPVQRQIATAWQEYSVLPDVVMVQYDAQVTPIDGSGALAAVQIGRGSTVSDSIGSRQAVVLFLPGTSATMQVGGQSVALPSMHFRATEFVGPSDPTQALPGDLPQTAIYTYAVDLGVDEAIAASATEVDFSQPVVFYVENYRGFPVGSGVPVSSYDRVRGNWIPANNGRIVKVLGISNGLADLDVDGSGVAASPATLAALSFTDAERRALTRLYQPGQSLWRVRVRHFSPCGLSWGPIFPLDAVFPVSLQQLLSPPVDAPVCKPGSIIEAENQVLGERVPVVGTPFSLNYRSNRAPGHKQTLRIPLGDNLPKSLAFIHVAVGVEGRFFAYDFPAVSGQVFTFGSDWDGTDVYGRQVQGLRPATVTLYYCYPVTYGVGGREFDFVTGAIVGGGFDPRSCLWTTTRTSIGSWDARAQGLGGWDLIPHHTYDPFARQLYLGDGRMRTAESLPNVVTYLSGTAVSSSTPAIAVGPDGSVFFTDLPNFQVHKRSPDGTISVVAGTGAPGFSGDGGPATSAQLGYPLDLALGPDGSLFIADVNNFRVRKVTPDGVIRTVAGNGGQEYSTATTQATSVGLLYASPIAVDAKGNLYIGDAGQVRKVSLGGTISTAAFFNQAPFTYFNSYGFIAGFITGLAVGPDGSLFVSVWGPMRIARVRPGGQIDIFAGNSLGPTSGDGGLAVAAGLTPIQLAAGPDGSLYVADRGVFPKRIRRIGPDGRIMTLAGGGYLTDDNAPATQANVTALSLSVGPDGSVYAGSNGRVIRIGPSLPGYRGFDHLVASEDGSELYDFDIAGRHLRTLDPITGVTRYTFAYDAGGRLNAVTDANGNVTTIARDATGVPSAILAPFGQGTALALDANGFLAGVSDPAGERLQFSYGPTGLLATFADARSNIHRFSFDERGRLSLDADPAGGSSALSYAGDPGDYSVAFKTALGRLSSYRVQNAGTGTELRVATSPDGLAQSTSTIAAQSSVSTTPDGTVLSSQSYPDPRFGMAAALESTQARLPSGLSLGVSSNRSAVLTDPKDLLSLRSLTESITFNGQSFTSTYDRASSTVTSTTPFGRRAVTTLDSLGRVVQVQAAGVLPVQVQYDSRGRPLSVAQGSRVFSYAYDSLGKLASLTDPLGRQVSFSYDLAGRPTRQVLPDGHAISLSYDPSGNVTSVTPPGRPAHSFAYTPVDLEQSYSPPSLGFQSTTQTSYDLDRAVSLISRSAGDSIVPSYDSAGRLSSLTTSAGTTTVSYDRNTGHLAQLSAPGGVGLGYGYDGALLTDITWSGPISGTVHSGYDSFFRVASESVSGGQPVSYQYDADGLLISAGALQIQRDPATGFFTGSSLGGTTESRSYDAYGQEASYTAGFGSSNLYSVAYTRDALGRIVSKTERVGSEAAHTFSYGYDLAGRLSDVSKDGAATAHYAYDANGNRITGPGLAATPTYDAQDRLLSSGACSYTYKASGELQTKTCPDGMTNYDYDALGNLRHVGLPNGKQIDYLIDGQNRRVGKKVNGVLVEGFLYRNQLQPAAWLDGAGAVKATFVYGLHANVPEYMVQGGTTYRLITDQVGSVRLVVNTSTGVVAERIDYDEFGNVLADTTPGTMPFGFAGGLRDPDTGLTRFGARDYDPVTGRWTSKDPEGLEGGLNVFEYAANDPINHIDPSGDDWLDWDLSRLQPVGDFSAGLADALTLNITSLLRPNGSVDECSGLYKAGAWTALALGTARLAYAGLAKGYSVAASSGEAASAFRRQLRIIFGGGESFRPPNLAKYTTDAALRAGAGRTNWLGNIWAAGASLTGAIINGTGRECGCQGSNRGQ